jgi:predicted transcriptional regulator
MRCLWTHGAATVREIHNQLTREVPLAYSSVLITCLRLQEKGLLERRRVTDADDATRPRSAYVYAPRMSEEAFTQAALAQQIDPLLTHYSAFVRAQQRPTVTRATASHPNGPATSKLSAPRVPITRPPTFTATNAAVPPMITYSNPIAA